ncbi:MAG: hypothetical protein J5565_05125 [Muribaculaceae bacterium]|nr:hypothetical protein [Muribaculaceae bacterium]
MKTHLLFVLVAMIAITTFASDNINGDEGRCKVNITQLVLSLPKFAEVQDPEAYYTISTAMLSIELDPVEYAEYTIILSTAYACIDYVVTSATVNIPVGALDDVIEIYIESDDCGCYYGVLDQSAYSNTY